MTNAAGKRQPDALLTEYSRLAEGYDNRWSRYVEASTRETMKRLTVRADDRVLDVGCGTGALLRKLSLAHPDVRLAGVDPVPAMLDVARRQLPPSVELCEGWAERLLYADKTFDVVVSSSVFHYVRRPVAALQEMHRVLRDGGELVITDWCDDYLACRVCNWYLRLTSEAYVGAYSTRHFARLVENAALGKASIERYKISWFWGLMTIKLVKRGP
jgi:ubiquinone/menaquinone biosynthesis C-methylase UbiE